MAGVVGRTTTSAGTSRVIAVDAAGAIRWSTEVPERGRGELYAIAALAGGGVAVGQAQGADGRDGAWIVRFAADGALESSQVLPTAATAGIAAARAVAATADGGFVVAGESLEESRSRRGRVWRFDGAGKLLWQAGYGDGESQVRGVVATPDGGAVVVGATQASGATLRPWIFSVDRLGAQRWTAR
jgi:DNA-binding beta-propeller fold protein YncE